MKLDTTSGIHRDSTRIAFHFHYLGANRLELVLALKDYKAESNAVPAQIANATLRIASGTCANVGSLAIWAHPERKLAVEASDVSHFLVVGCLFCQFLSAWVMRKHCAIQQEAIVRVRCLEKFFIVYSRERCRLFNDDMLARGQSFEDPFLLDAIQVEDRSTCARTKDIEQ